MFASVMITALVAATPESPPAAYADCFAVGGTLTCVRARPSACAGGATEAIVVPVRIASGTIEVVGGGSDLTDRILDSARAAHFRPAWANELRTLAFAPAPGVVTYLLAFLHDTVKCQDGFPSRGELELEYAGSGASVVWAADAPIPMVHRLQKLAAAAVAKLIKESDPRMLVRDACFSLPE